jgi:hypothetical protein
MSSHACHRAQQRGIPPLIVDWLDLYGEETHDHHGAVIHHFTKKSRRKLEKSVGREPVRKMDQWLAAYIVRSMFDGAILTVGHRWKPLKHRGRRE